MAVVGRRRVIVRARPGAGVYRVEPDGTFVAVGRPLPIGPLTVRFRMFGGWHPWGQQ